MDDVIALFPEFHLGGLAVAPGKTVEQRQVAARLRGRLAVADQFAQDGDPLGRRAAEAVGEAEVGQKREVRGVEGQALAIDGLRVGMPAARRCTCSPACRRMCG